MKKIILSLIAVMACMSINAQVIKVYKNNGATPEATYTNTTTDKYKVVFEEAPAPTGPEYVTITGSDGTKTMKWATKNLGATTVADSPATAYGDYYAWGETQPRYTSITISSDGTSATFGGWSSSHSSGYSTSDYPSYTGTTLDADHDAATKNWGSDWRTPTADEFQWLATACGGSFTKKITTSEDIPTTKGIYFIDARDATYKVAGMLFIDSKGASVFFPAAGLCNSTRFGLGGSLGDYWSSSLFTSNTNLAYYLYFNSSSVNPSGSLNRYYGFTVRPVSE